MASVPFNNLITFSRGSNATLTGPTGLVQWAPSNLLTFSEQFDNAGWTKTNATATANATTAPDGTTTADAVIPTVTPAVNKFVQQIFTSYISGTTYTHSVYAKAFGYTGLQIVLPAAAFAGPPFANFDLANGIASVTYPYGGSGATATITSVGNGWYRCSVTMTATGTAATAAQLRVMNTYTTTDTTYTANGTSGIYLWGAQLELGSAATTYNSTTVKNLLGFSEAFDNAGWNKANASIVTGAQANPVNGAFNAQKLMENATGSTDHTAYTNAITAIVGTTYVISFYAKAAGRNWAAVGNFDSSWRRAYFDLVNGVVGTVDAGITAQIVSVGSGWYRCSVTRVMASTSIYAGVWTASANGTITYTGDGNSGIYIYGAQLSDSASLDPYVPTPAAAPSSTAFYGPRFDYDPVTLAPKGLLVEEARTNLQTYSEDFTNAIWTKTGATITANVATPPSGVANADKLVEDTSTGTHNVFNAGAGAAGAHTFSVWAKAAGRNWIVLRLEGVDTYFDLGNGILGSVGVGITATIRTFDNAWFRCTVTKTMAGAAAATFRLATSDGVSSYTGDGVSGVFLWGAQLEAGAFATSYIPTVAATVTRAADVATINGSLFSQWYAQTEGTFTVGFTSNGFASNAMVFSATDGTLTNLIQSYWSNATTITMDGGALATMSLTAAQNTRSTLAYAYKLNDYAAAINGGSVTTDTSGTPPPTMSQLNIGNRNGALFMSGHIRSINFIPARAADFQLQALTT